MLARTLYATFRCVFTDLEGAYINFSPNSDVKVKIIDVIYSFYFYWVIMQLMPNLGLECFNALLEEGAVRSDGGDGK